MTALSSGSGTVDNFWSRDDIRVHTFGGSPKAVEVLVTDLFEGKPTRTAGAKRRGAEAARQRRGSRLCGRVQSASDGSRRRRHVAGQAAKTRMTWNATSASSLTPSCANCVTVNNARLSRLPACLCRSVPFLRAELRTVLRRRGLTGGVCE